MTIYYDFRKKLDLRSTDQETVLTPHVVSSGTVPARKLYEQLEQATTFRQGEIEGMLDGLIEQMIFELKNGRVVELGKLGYFSLKITSRPVTDKQTIHAQSIAFKNVNFRPSAWFKEQFKGLSFARAPEGYRSSVSSRPDHRKKLLEHYLHTHPFISRTAYTSLTGLLKNKALAELHAWVKEGFLDIYGRGSHKVFIKGKAFPENSL
ncbi:MAG: HU family DNA-binding protein [Tannerellaceae bacterium]|nr:HU family DNA-binding protein [Tannerellaceae bacterium]